MKNIIHLAKKWLKSSPGFTLVELLVAMIAGSFLMGGVFAVWTSMFNVTATNSNYMVAFRQVQNGGSWVSHDALMTQAVYDMASGVLAGGISDDPDLDTIQVDSTDGFPSSGVICISALGTDSEDELIQYASKTDTEFTDCIRGANATGHDDGASVTFFVALNWTDWEGDQHQVVYNLKESSEELVRSYLIKGVSEDSYSLESSIIIAEAIVVDETRTYNVWNYDDKELTVVITAEIGNEPAIRTYKVNPRPLF